MNVATLAGHLAFGLIAFSFLVKDIFWLRIVSIIASLFSVFYNYTIPETKSCILLYLKI